MGQLEEQNKRVLHCNSKYKIESIYIYTDKAKWLNKLRNQGEETNLSCREIPNNLHGYSALKELDCVDSLCIVYNDSLRTAKWLPSKDYNMEIVGGG